MNAQSNATLRTGREVPVLGLGTWQLTRDAAQTLDGLNERYSSLGVLPYF